LLLRYHHHRLNRPAAGTLGAEDFVPPHFSSSYEFYNNNTCSPLSASMRHLTLALFHMWRREQQLRMRRTRIDWEATEKEAHW
jgi:hypothetical protein